MFIPLRIILELHFLVLIVDVFISNSVALFIYHLGTSKGKKLEGTLVRMFSHGSHKIRTSLV